MTENCRWHYHGMVLIVRVNEVLVKECSWVCPIAMSLYLHLHLIYLVYFSYEWVIQGNRLNLLSYSIESDIVSPQTRWRFFQFMLIRHASEQLLWLVLSSRAPTWREVVPQMALNVISVAFHHIVGAFPAMWWIYISNFHKETHQIQTANNRFLQEIGSRLLKVWEVEVD